MGEKDVLEEISIHNKNIVINRFNNAEELIEWETNNNKDLIENITYHTDENYVNSKNKL